MSDTTPCPEHPDFQPGSLYDMRLHGEQYHPEELAAAADEAFIQGHADTRRPARPQSDPALQYAPYFEVPGVPPPPHLAPSPLLMVAHLYAAILTLPPSAEKTAACRKLLEARDCIVRATP